jgi:hypothetical protein
MNFLFVMTSFIWTVAMSILMVLTDISSTKIMAFSIIARNVISTVCHFIIDNNKKSLELRVYTDNLIILLLIIKFPHELFYGYPVQILFSIIITHLYMRKRTRIYDILLFLSITELFIYVPICSFTFPFQLMCNTLSMLLLISVLAIIKKKLLLDPEKRYKKVLLDTNNLIKHEIIECITPMMYYIRNLDEENKEKMEQLINKLKYIAQNNTNNFGYLITIIKSTLSYTYKHGININLADQTTKILKIDSYTLLLVLYVIFDSLGSNSATEIVIKLNNKKIEIIGNGEGFNTKSKNFLNSKLKTAIELIELHDIPITFSSVVGTGTIITLFIE